MDERIEKWLFDIRIAIDEINGYFKDGEKNLHSFSKTKC
jgi:hypothetical protein